MKNFLSIDWDYFIGATSTERATMFPDSGSERLPQHISDLVWSIRYADTKLSAEVDKGTDMASIGVIEREFNALIEYIQSRNLTVVATESHSVAYEVFNEYLDAGETCNLINIDFHHDLYTNNAGEVDCGNWLREFNKSVHIDELLWVSREDSDKVPNEAKDYLTQTTNLIDVLANMEEPDCIFICRSGAWSPPHLDAKFNELLEASQVEPYPDRYTEDFKESVKTYYASTKNFITSREVI